MVHGLLRTETPEEREYRRYMVEVESRQGRVAELQAELAALKLALSHFNAEYQTRVGTLFAELDRARLAIDEYERRIAYVQSDQGDLSHVEQEIEAEFAARRQDVRDEEEETQRYRESFERERDRPQLDAGVEVSLKARYRELAKRYHPDLSRTEDERRRREAIMQQVNAAFGERDEAALRSIEQTADASDPAFEARSIGEKLVWAIREVARLDEVISRLDAEAMVIQESEVHGLWQRQESGEAVIETLEQDIQQQLATSRNHLAALIATYRQVLEGGVH